MIYVGLFLNLATSLLLILTGGLHIYRPEAVERIRPRALRWLVRLPPSYVELPGWRWGLHYIMVGLASLGFVATQLPLPRSVRLGIGVSMQALAIGTIGLLLSFGIIARYRAWRADHS